MNSKLRGFYYLLPLFHFLQLHLLLEEGECRAAVYLPKCLSLSTMNLVWVVRARFILTSFSTFGDYHQLCTRMKQLSRKSWNIQKKIRSTGDTWCNGIPRPIWNSKPNMEFHIGLVTPITWNSQTKHRIPCLVWNSRLVWEFQIYHGIPNRFWNSKSNLES